VHIVSVSELLGLDDDCPRHLLYLHIVPDSESEILAALLPMRVQIVLPFLS
jgi:hypothetical protein